MRDAVAVTGQILQLAGLKDLNLAVSIGDDAGHLKMLSDD